MTEIASPLAGALGSDLCDAGPAHRVQAPSLSLPRSVLATLLLVMLFGGQAASAVPVDAPALMGRLQARYRSMRTLKVKFEQIFHSPVAEQRESGVLYFRRPNRMRWEYLSPKAKLFVLDGKKTYFYVPEDRQVSVSQWREESAALPLLFLLGDRDAARDFQIEAAEGVAPLAGGDFVLRLTPRTEQSEIKEVVVEGRRDRNEIVRLSILEHGGNRNDYLFSAPEPNARISDDLFKFRIPKGVEVLEAEQ
jgi:outer membrane lipoprotein carrier protein